MPTEKINLAYTVNGNIFQVGEHYHTQSNPPGPPQGFTVVVHNQSGDWVDVNIDRSIDPSSGLALQGVASTGHVAKGTDGGFSEQLSVYLSGKDNKITRWRPGAFGIPGNGGGEIHFSVPNGAESVVLEITVTG